MVELDASFVPARAASVHTVEIDGEAVLLDEHGDRLHHLNRSAALLWACFDGTTPIGELAGEIADELELPGPEVLATSLDVLRRLAAEGLLEGIEASP